MKVKHKDWSSWWAGLRTSALASGAKAASTTMTTWTGSNLIDSLHVPGLGGVGMSWKTALIQLAVQFTYHSGKAIFEYVTNKPDADIIEEDFPTAQITKQQTESTNEQKSNG